MQPHPQIFQLDPQTPQAAVLALHTIWTLREDLPAWAGHHRTITWEVPGVGEDQVVRYVEHAEWMARFFVLPAQEAARRQVWEVLMGRMGGVELEGLFATVQDELTPQHVRVEALLATAPYFQGARTDEAYFALLERLIDEEHGPLTHAAVAILGDLPWAPGRALLEVVAQRGDFIASEIAQRALDASA